LAYRGGSAVSVFRAKEDSVILPTGDRAALTFKSEISPTSSFTIRKFPRYPWTPTRMLSTGMLSIEAMAFLWLCIDAKLPVVVFGPMGSGKTSLANALTILIRPDASIAICQDAPEMRVPHENVLDLYERRSRSAGSSGEVTLEDLLAHALRRSVDYVTINEVRSRREVYAFAQAVSLGHGGITSIHAESVEAVFGRLKGYGVEEPLAENIRVLVGTGLFIGERNGKRVRLRRVKGIYFVKSLESYRPVYDTVFRYEPSEDTLEPHYTNEALTYLAEKLYLEEDVDLLKQELRLRVEFLELTTKAGFYDADRLFLAMKEFRQNPKSALEQLRRFYSERMKRRSSEPAGRAVIIADARYLKYCPHCGAELPPNVSSCPKCGFRFYSRLEEELKKVLSSEGSERR
ncbi:MAG: Flp pilus assembly complex ATPase component TadA, partial [Armatimonadetes bacterium]|nr:Flp pilus assembly complex ATPase component TadA [Armatimonadota bacterium]